MILNLSSAQLARPEQSPQLEGERNSTLAKVGPDFARQQQCWILSASQHMVHPAVLCTLSLCSSYPSASFPLHLLPGSLCAAQNIRAGVH